MNRPTVVYLGGKQAGCVGLLTLYAANCRIASVVAYDELVHQLARTLHLVTFSSIKETGFQQTLSSSDLLVSVHGREIIPKSMLDLLPLGGINVHPCLYQYKGANPVQRLLDDGNTRASVGVHRMTEAVDEGEVLVEEFVEVSTQTSAVEVYNELYPYYALALLKTLKKIMHA